MLLEEIFHNVWTTTFQKCYNRTSLYNLIQNLIQNNISHTVTCKANYLCAFLSAKYIYIYICVCVCVCVCVLNSSLR